MSPIVPLALGGLRRDLVSIDDVTRAWILELTHFLELRSIESLRELLGRLRNLDVARREAIEWIELYERDVRDERQLARERDEIRETTT